MFVNIFNICDKLKILEKRNGNRIPEIHCKHTWTLCNSTSNIDEHREAKKHQVFLIQ